MDFQNHENEVISIWEFRKRKTPIRNRFLSSFQVTKIQNVNHQFKKSTKGGSGLWIACGNTHVKTCGELSDHKQLCEGFDHKTRSKLTNNQLVGPSLCINRKTGVELEV